MRGPLPMLTGLLIAILIIGTATAVGGGFVYAVSKRKQLDDGGSDTKLLTDGRGDLIVRGLNELRVGDVVQYGGVDYLVEGVVAYDEDGHKWTAGRIVDGKDVQWLVVGMERIGAANNVRLMKHDPEFENDGYPPESLHSGGVRYRQEKRGTASAKFYGDVGEMPGKRGDKALDTVERCRWWRYESAGDETMVIEQWGGEYRALRGAHVTDGLIEMIPGS